MAIEWFYEVGGETRGPVSAKELRSLAEAGTVTPDTRVKRGGDPKWVSARRVQGLFGPGGVKSAEATPAPTKAPPLPVPVCGSTKLVPDAVADGSGAGRLWGMRPGHWVLVAGGTAALVVAGSVFFFSGGDSSHRKAGEGVTEKEPANTDASRDASHMSRIRKREGGSGVLASPSDRLSLADIIEEAAPAVVRITVYDITGAKTAEGSGFFIGGGKIVTNAHVMERAYSAKVDGFLESYKRVTVAKRNDDVDLALLEVEDRREPNLVLSQNGFRPGERVIAIGNPLGLERTVSDGLISAVRGIPGEIQVIQISAPISPGSSGGPLLNVVGEVIGVTSASVSEGQNLNFAIGCETLSQFLGQPDKRTTLEEAGTRVLWRTILKWVVTIVVGFLVLVFSEHGWWVIGIVVLVVMLAVYFLKGLWAVLTWAWKKGRPPRP